MREKIRVLKTFDWKLFVALVLLSLVPAIIQTVDTLNFMQRKKKILEERLKW